MTRLETDLDRIRTLTAGIVELERARDLLVIERRELLLFLRDQGLSLRTLAGPIGLSPQRLSQIMHRNKRAA